MKGGKGLAEALVACNTEMGGEGRARRGAMQGAKRSECPVASRAFATPQRAPYRADSDFRFQCCRPLDGLTAVAAAARSLHRRVGCDREAVARGSGLERHRVSDDGTQIAPDRRGAVSAFSRRAQRART